MSAAGAPHPGVALLVRGDRIELHGLMELDTLRADEDGLARDVRGHRNDRRPRTRDDGAVALDRARAEEDLRDGVHNKGDRVEVDVGAAHAAREEGLAENLPVKVRPPVDAHDLKLLPVLHDAPASVTLLPYVPQ